MLFARRPPELTTRRSLIAGLVGLPLACGRPAPERRATDDGGLERLRSVAYVNSTPDRGEGVVGVTVHESGATEPGFHLFCLRDRPEAVLMDLEGRVVHRWRLPADEARGVWEHAVLTDEGTLLVLEKFSRLLALDVDSTVLWQRRLSVHHDLVLDTDGQILTLVRAIQRHRGLRGRFTEIHRLTADGRPVARWSSYDALAELASQLDVRYFLDTQLDDADDHQRAMLEEKAGEDQDGALYDYFHGNSLLVMPQQSPVASDPRFGGGNVMICLRNVNQLVLLERDTWRVVWSWGEDVLDAPHHPTLTDSGNLLVFDNGFERGWSRVLELALPGMDVVWQYGGPGTDFHTPRKGSAQRLDNGNTLLCEGDRGRVFEVTPGGDIVWEWWNPTLEDGERATLYRCERLPPEQVRVLGVTDAGR